MIITYAKMVWLTRIDYYYLCQTVLLLLLLLLLRRHHTVRPQMHLSCLAARASLDLYFTES
jgi:hypothetical protein